MACALPFAAEAALVRAQLEQAVEVAAAWALRTGLLEVGTLENRIRWFWGGNSIAAASTDRLSSSPQTKQTHQTTQSSLERRTPPPRT